MIAHLASVLLCALLLIPPSFPSAAPALYGLTRVKCPAGVPHAISGCAQLVSVDDGKLTNIGEGHNPLAAVGDLRVITDDVYYVLADNCGGPCNATGTVLLGISLKDGSEVCRAEVPTFAEIGLVGGGQSMSHDAKNKRLLLSGMNSTDGGKSYTHVLLSASLATPGSCGPFTRVGTFGDADYEPLYPGAVAAPGGEKGSADDSRGSLGISGLLGLSTGAGARPPGLSGFNPNYSLGISGGFM